MSRLFKIAVLYVAALAACSLAFGQDVTGKIAGVITDPSGATVANATVTVTDVGRKTSKTATTDANGFYQVSQLPPGNYQVSAESPGFSKIVSNGQNSLEINQTLRIDLKLQVGAVSSTVEVSAESSIVETQNSTIGGTVTGQAVYELPLNGRNVLDLMATQTGVTPTNPDNTGAGGGYSIAGGRTDSVTFLLDGGNNNSLLNNSFVANPNPDAVQEFRVLESNYSAEYGRNAGGVVSVVTKSGTNSLHGTLYDYLRNEDLNANDFFKNEQGLPKNILKRNQFGGTVGGPIMIPKIVDGRNKLFFFFSYQGQRQSSIAQTGSTPVYTPLEAQGNFSQAVNGGPDPNVVKFLTGHPYYQPNPALASQAIIAPNRIDPVALNYLKNGLVPISPTGILFPQGSAKDNIDEYLGRFDYNITSRDTLNGTFTAHGETQLNPFSPLVGGPNVPGYSNTNGINSYFATVTYNHTFTPTLLNEFRATAQRLNNLSAQPSGSLPGPNALGIGNTPDASTGPTIIGLSGSGTTFGFDPQGPTTLINNTYAIYDNLSWTRSNHDFKAGFYFSPYQNNTVYDYYINGEFFFYGPSTGVGSGTDLADFLLGLPDEYLQFPKAPSNIRSKQYAGYVQDQWHLSKRFTLNLGLRYEYAQPKFDTQGRSFSFIPGLQSTRFPGAPRGEVFPGDAGAPKGSNFPDKNDFAPRFGFAWDVFGNGKTSVRGGFGMFNDILKAEDNLQFNGQAPFFGFVDITNTYTTPDPAATTSPGYLQQPFTSVGVVNPFPSKPPTSSLNFANAGFLPVGGGGVFFVDPRLRTPYVYQYNLSVQQQLASGLVLDLGYLGSDSHKLTALVDVNPFVPGTSIRINNSGDPTNGTFSYLDEFQNLGKSNYNAFQVSLTKRVTNNRYFGNTFFTLAYTWGHEIDNSSGYRQRNSQVPYFNHDQFRASGDFDLRNSLTFSGGWDLPFDHLWERGPKLLTRGWSLYPLVTWRTGFPLDVFGGLSVSRTDPGPSGAGDANLVRADLVGNTVTTFDPHNTQTLAGQTGNYYFNPGNFSNVGINSLDKAAKADPTSIIGQFTYGTFPRNALRGPGFVNADLSLAKHLIFGEGKLDVELRGDAFNVLNHTNFGTPNTTINSSAFGTVSYVVGATSTTNPTGPRIIQVAIHLRF